METETIVAIDYQKWVQPAEKVKRCPACMTVFGKEIRNGEMLDIGLIVVSVLHGQCRSCGHSITWYTTDRLMRSLAERIKAR